MSKDIRYCRHCRQPVEVTEVPLKDGQKAKVVEVFFCPRCDVPPKDDK